MSRYGSTLGVAALLLVCQLGHGASDDCSVVSVSRDGTRTSRCAARHFNILSAQMWPKARLRLLSLCSAPVFGQFESPLSPLMYATPSRSRPNRVPLAHYFRADLLNGAEPVLIDPLVVCFYPTLTSKIGNATCTYPRTVCADKHVRCRGCAEVDAHDALRGFSTKRKNAAQPPPFTDAPAHS